LDYGAHLPLIALDRQPWALQRLLEYAVSAESVGFQALAANDHLVFPRPWLDGPTALAAVLGRTGQMAVAPHVSAWRGLRTFWWRLIRPSRKHSFWDVG
jgi:hypothetical protein